MELRSIKSVADELGVDRRIVSFLIDANGIVTHPVPLNGKAKGLDASSVRKLTKLVRAGLKAKAASA